MKKITLGNGEVIISAVDTAGVSGLLFYKCEKAPIGSVSLKKRTIIDLDKIMDKDTVLIEVENHESADVLLDAVTTIWRDLKKAHWDEKSK